MVGVTGALIGGALIGGVTSVVSGNKAANASKDAAKTAAGAQDRASETQLQIFQQQRADYAPWQQVGQGALYKLADMYGVSRPVDGAQDTTIQKPTQQPLAAMYGGGLYGFGGTPQTVGQAVASDQPKQEMTAGFDGFEASPGYQFRVDEAMKAIERSAAARGSLRSGATMDALQRRVQGVASDEYNTYANRLAALAGVGQAAVAGQAQAGAQYGQTVQQGATAQGNIAMAAGNARASAYQNTGNAINSGVQNLTSAYLYNQGFGGKA